MFTKETRQSKPIPSSWFTKTKATSNNGAQEETSVVKEEDETAYKHTMEAIAAITEEELEFCTPPQLGEVEDMEEDTTEQHFPAVLPDTTRLRCIAFDDSSFDQTPNARRSSYHLASCRRQSSMYQKFSRSKSIASTTQEYPLNLFGTNKENVERILKRMANAIQKDLGHQ